MRNTNGQKFLGQIEVFSLKKWSKLKHLIRAPRTPRSNKKAKKIQVAKSAPM